MAERNLAEDKDCVTQSLNERESVPTWDAELYDARHAFVWQRAADLVDLLAPQTGERILDLGCGTGHLTAQIASCGAEVVGIDSSQAMIEEAWSHYPTLKFHVADARTFSFAQCFDAVFSNAALHWINEAGEVIRCVEKVLRPAGRFVAEFGGKGNVQKLVDAFYRSFEALGIHPAQNPNPWYFPSISEYSFLLERQGLETVSAILFDRPTPLEEGEDGMRNWIRMFAGQFLAVMPEDRQNEFMSQTECILRPELFRGGSWIVDYRRLRIVARKPASAVI